MGHSELPVGDMDRYDRLQARRRHVNTCMHDDSTETEDPVPDGSTLQIDGMLLFSGTSASIYLVLVIRVMKTIISSLEWMLFAKLNAQWIMFHARQISQQSI